MIPKKVIITDKPPERFRPAISQYFKNDISEGVSIDVIFEEDGYEVEKLIEEVNFTSGKPLILGTSWELTLDNKKNALFFEISTPSSETLIVNRSHIGYKGALQFLERIYSASVGGK